MENWLVLKKCFLAFLTKIWDPKKFTFASENGPKRPNDWGSGKSKKKHCLGRFQKFVYLLISKHCHLASSAGRGSLSQINFKLLWQSLNNFFLNVVGSISNHFILFQLEYFYIYNTVIENKICEFYNYSKKWFRNVIANSEQCNDASFVNI